VQSTVVEDVAMCSPDVVTVDQSDDLNAFGGDTCRIVLQFSVAPSAGTMRTVGYAASDEK